MSIPHLARIDLYPLKSLDGQRVERARILPSGALQHDRAYALFDDQGQVVNGKRFAQIHRLRSQISASFQTLTLVHPSLGRAVFDLEGDRTALAQWLSEYFQIPIQIRHNPVMGFPDDTESPGPTVISTATLETVASWYPNLTVEKLRSRLRTNLEVDGVPPFWEDQLFNETDEGVIFKIGDTCLIGINPCQRCIVPTRDPHSGAPTPEFQKIFIQQRQHNLPSWTTPSRFNHYYRLAVNTRIANTESHPVLCQGDPVMLL
ncbi:MAG: MOSC domain-containing protein [Acaryochloridaceae cyanobacterium SU_2_1]|nr:MOSC domain-containing protein [Acaryochloridaceae cyanobacterium SU_2_1]